MLPVPNLVAALVHGGSHHGIINIFAGIPAAVTGEINLDSYIEKQLYFIVDETGGTETSGKVSKLVGKERIIKWLILML